VWTRMDTLGKPQHRSLWNGVRAFFKGSKLQMIAAQGGLQAARDVCEGSSCKRSGVENHLLAADVQRLRLDRERTHEFFAPVDRYAPNEHQLHVLGLGMSQRRIGMRTIAHQHEQVSKQARTQASHFIADTCDSRRHRCCHLKQGAIGNRPDSSPWLN